MMQIRPEIDCLCHAFLQGLKEMLGAKLHGVYLYGSVVFPETTNITDVDFHVILAQPLSDTEKSQLRRLHVDLARQYPPLGGELDGYYILLEDARKKQPPPHQFLEGVFDDSWALHRAHIHAGKYIALYGPDPVHIYPAAAWEEIDLALQGELDFVAKHLEDHPAYCVLNLCRIMYSYQARNVVVSKQFCAEWAIADFTEWKDLISAALLTYGQETATRNAEMLKTCLPEFFDFVNRRIRELSH